jgi:hypothetical protein
MRIDTFEIWIYVALMAMYSAHVLTLLRLLTR